jgi:hypothetical protein
MDDTTHAFSARLQPAVPARMPLPGQLVLETADLLAARDHLSRFLWPHSVMPTARRPPVAFRHCSASLGQVSIHALHYGAAVQIEAHPDDSYLFLVLLHGAGTLSQDGFTGALNPQIIRAMNPTGPATMRFLAGEVNLTLRIPAALAARLARRDHRATGFGTSCALRRPPIQAPDRQTQRTGTAPLPALPVRTSSDSARRASSAARPCAASWSEHSSAW